MKQLIENAAAELDMNFLYGDRPSMNLSDSEDCERYKLWLLPLENKPELNEFNSVVANNWSVALFIFRQSELDAGAEGAEQYYHEKWDLHIKPLYEEDAVGRLTGHFTCRQSITISQMQVKEVINLFSENLDGLYITFNAREDLI